MARSTGNSALLKKYQDMYKGRPRSRVFAPLAETYRKLGLLDDAFNILREGLKNHPTYTMGHIVLGNCYYDKQMYDEAYATVRPYIESNKENISLQKLFGNTCLKLGHLEQALNTFKNLLLLNPKDIYAAEQIKSLEDDLAYEQQQKVEELGESVLSDYDEDGWVQVNFSSTPQVEEPYEVDRLEAYKSDVNDENLEVPKHSLDDSYFHEDFDNASQEVITAEEDDITIQDLPEKPIITHTLVDLYCDQGHPEKAIEVLESILETHPTDQATIKRLAELRSESAPKTAMSEKELLLRVETSFHNFLNRLQLRRQEALKDLVGNEQSTYN